MASKIFDVAQMACEDVQAWVGSAKFCTGTDDASTYAEVNDGAFVVLGGLCDDATYTGEKDWNCYKAFAPSADTLTVNDGVHVIDISGVAEGVIAGNGYKIGVKQVDLKGKPGYAMRTRKLCQHDRFWLGAGCFASTPTVGKFANLTASSTLLTPAESANADKLTFAIRAAKPLTLGSTVPSASGSYEYEYLVEVL